MKFIAGIFKRLWLIIYWILRMCLSLVLMLTLPVTLSLWCLCWIFTGSKIWSWEEFFDYIFIVNKLSS